MPQENPSRKTTTSSRADNKNNNAIISEPRLTLTNVNRLNNVQLVTIGFKVPVEVWVKYHSLSKNDKFIVKQILEKVIAELAGAGGQGGAQNVNININVQNVEVKQEIRVEEKLLVYLERLYALRDPLPPLQRELVEKAYREAKRLLVP